MKEFDPKEIFPYIVNIADDALNYTIKPENQKDFTENELGMWKSGYLSGYVAARKELDK